MVNRDMFFSSDADREGEKIPLLKSICALELVPQEHGGAKLGLLLQLGAGITVEVCGDGFDDRTAKVRANGHCYFVFLQDLASQATAASH